MNHMTTRGIEYTRQYALSSVPLQKRVAQWRDVLAAEDPLAAANHFLRQHYGYFQIPRFQMEVVSGEVIFVNTTAESLHRKPPLIGFGDFCVKHEDMLYDNHGEVKMTQHWLDNERNEYLRSGEYSSAHSSPSDVLAITQLNAVFTEVYGPDKVWGVIPDFLYYSVPWRDVIDVLAKDSYWFSTSHAESCMNFEQLNNFVAGDLDIAEVNSCLSMWWRHQKFWALLGAEYTADAIKIEEAERVVREQGFWPQLMKKLKRKK